MTSAAHDTPETLRSLLKSTRRCWICRGPCGTLILRIVATQNNLHVPDDLLSAANEAARADGITTDELAADALRRYLAHRKLEELGKYGREQSQRLGYTEADVSGLIAESRREDRGR